MACYLVLSCTQKAAEKYLNGFLIIRNKNVQI